MATRVHGSKGRTFIMPVPILTAKSIGGISKASPGEVTTTTNHGLATGQSVLIRSVVGMTEVNNRVFTIIKTADNKFTIGVNTSSYTTWSSGGSVTPLGVNVPIVGWEGTKAVATADATSGADGGATNVTAGPKSFRGTVTCLWDTALETAVKPFQVEEGDEVILILFPSDGRGYWTVPALVTEEPIRAQGNATAGWSFSFQNQGAYAWVPSA